MPKPGLSRAIPFAIFGFLFGFGLVLVIRALQNMDPVWDVGVALSIAPFTTMFFFVWGMGAFDSRMQHHGDHEEEHVDVDEHAVSTDVHDEEEEEHLSPLGILVQQTWLIVTIVLLAILGMFVIAFINTFGLRLDTVNEANSSVSAIGYDDGGVSQLVMLFGFFAFAMISMFIIAGGIGMFFYFSSRSIKQAELEEETPTPPRFIQAIGRGLNAVARGLKKGVPSLLGQKE